MKDEILNEAINIVDGERAQWDRATVFITPQVAMNMRTLIEYNRKNFWGVFENPKDETTGKDKTWIPMTMRDVEAIATAADVDLKDMMFRAKTPEGVEFADITRYVVRNYLEKMHFGETLDETLRQLLIDGTVVWKTWEENGKLRRKTVDLLNVYMDPQEENIQCAYRFTERALLLPSDISKMSGWMDKKAVKGSNSLDRTDSNQQNKTTGNYVDVWEMWGKIPKWLITSKAADKKSGEEIDGHIIVSGLQSGDKRVHLIEANSKKTFEGDALKPYEEGRLAKVSNRWYGLGIAEREMALQEWLNLTVNQRINRQTIAQLGLFKVRQGSGITPQMLSQLSTNGVIPVQSMQDIEQLPMNEPGPASYQDEQIIRDWAQSITQAYPIATGENVPASQTATTSAIQNTNSRQAFSMVKDAMEFLLVRWMDRHALPIIIKGVKPEEIIRVMGDDDSYKEIAERIVLYYANDWLNTAKVVDPVALEKYIDDMVAELQKKPQVFFKLTKKILAEGLEAKFYTNNESMDTQSTVQNLIAMAQTDPAAAPSYMGYASDLMGLPRPRREKAPEMPPGQGENPEQTIQDMTQMVYGVGQGNSSAITQS